MANILIKPPWSIDESQVTPEKHYQHRRTFLRQLGFTGALLALPGCSKSPSPEAALPDTNPVAAANPKLYPAPRNAEFNPNWTLTNAEIAATYNNFYEFSTEKHRVRELVGPFVTAPWTLEISGLVEKPMKLEVAEILEMFPLEERVYRFRCVEAWAMVVPWTGFPLSKLIDKVSPKPEAKFLRFETFNRPDQAVGMRSDNFPWPYFEGLRMDEARHPLTLFTTGIYGKPLPKQHGAPIRVIVPWKYGYKSIKSMVKMEFVAAQPKTFWETLLPEEYPFESNVDPSIPHPRWSQATERIIDTGLRVKTQPYNGYGSQVAQLYKKT